MESTTPAATTPATTDSPGTLKCVPRGEVWRADADGSPCGDRIGWLTRHGYTLGEAMAQVAHEYPEECGACGTEPVPEPTPAPTFAPATGDKTRLLTFNVWWKNKRYEAIADLIAEVNADIVDLQESVPFGGDDKLIEIIKALNAKGLPFKAAYEHDASAYWCGLTIYRSDKFHDPEWTRNVAKWQNSDVSKERGICGAMLERKSDSKKLCVWGGHPGWSGDQRAWWAKDLVQAGRDAMKECADQYQAPSVFMCDCNSPKHWQISNELKKQLDKTFETAAHSGYDHIYTEAGVLQSSDPVALRDDACCKGQQDRACWRNAPACSEWAYSDHPPVFVDIQFAEPDGRPRRGR
eukprot:TRINITY_DN6148_c0_g1_i6.p1 TRINITY_DN6148_c0_g1~~TRINITY_DN6148_c0_g1_i6.p1  ORF type:complete len:351 (+),score=62.33 TRINITY_DN6148_c0_g1_i6:669-1721(+)